ncbi:MAG: IS4 family transposase [Saprospiraceae bacterium]
MELNPSTKVYKMIRELKVVPHKSRQEFSCSMLEGIIRSRSVIFSEIADKIDSPAKVESIERRIQSFFKEVSIDYDQLPLFFLSFVHHEKLTLSMDRTEWDFGKTQINILCVVVSIGKMAVPLYFEMLDNNSGNSNYKDRIELLKKIIRIIGKERISVLIMDREFIGYKWLSWLRQERIPFCVRVPKHHRITLDDGTKIKANQLVEKGKKVYLRDVFVDLVRVNVSISLDANGDLLYLIGTLEPSELGKTYRKRWTIEVFFQALKARGFNMEASCLKSIEKYRKLFALVSIAYTICWAIGIEDGRVNPVKVKKHGYPQFSVFRRGLNLMRAFFKHKIIEPINRTLDLALIKLEHIQKIIG